MNLHAILVSTLGLFLFVSCKQQHIEEPHKSKFQVINPVVKDTLFTRDYVCQIRAIQHIEVRTLEEGYLQDIFVDEGEFVKEGRLMFQLNPRLFLAELNKAKAEVQFAEIEYENTKVLADQKIVSPNELALRKAKLDKVKAEMELAEAHLGFTRIKAPFSGFMDRFQVRKGSLLEEGELLTTLSDNRRMWVYFNVPEAEYLDYKSSIKKDSLVPVELRMANNKIFGHIGEIEVIEADFNNETGNIAFRAGFDNPEGILRHGETGNIQVAIPLPQAMLIPQKCTFEILDKKFVFVLNENNEVITREIQIAEEISHIYVVAGGLSPSDVVLLEGIGRVREKQQIVPIPTNSDSVLTHLDMYAE
jgi:membrane fusion protein (multidrug efflux system)